MKERPSGISTHVLDTSRGRPASGIDVTLEFLSDTLWETRGNETTDDDGRIGNLLSQGEGPVKGVYRLTFETGSYFRRKGRATLYPQVVVIFEAMDTGEHLHIPLLLDAFGYTTYRGS